MRRAMESLQDLIEEAKVRTVCWAICVFAISYFLTHTSKSMWINIPISILILAAFRYLSYEVELRWRVRPAPKPTYLAHLEQKKLTLDDFRLSTSRPSSGWRSKIDSPSVEAAIERFVDKILQDFVLDLWYSSISPDKEAPELIRAIILDVLGEVSAKVKEINLVDLLTRDLVDLIGNQLDLYRKNQSEIGADVMATLSFEERDERLKQHLLAAKKLHPALYSLESEYKVLQRIVGGILTIVLKPQEAQSPLVHCIARELLTCLILQPVMNFASPWYINELIESILLNNNASSNVETDPNKSSQAAKSIQNSQISIHDSQIISTNVSKDLVLVKDAHQKSLGGLEHSHSKTLHKDTLQHAPTKPADWAVGLDAATKRRTEVLAPENLENMWTKGRHYQKKSANLIKPGSSPGIIKDLSSSENSALEGSLIKESVTNLSESIKGINEKYMVHLMHESMNNERNTSLDMVEHRKEKTHFVEYEENSRETSKTTHKVQLKESYSTPHIDAAREGGESAQFRDNYGPNYYHRRKEQSSELVSHGEGPFHVPNIRCRIVGAYFEKLGSKSFAVYSIAVTDAENKTWFVKRRYRNFERLHRQLKDIPNYSFHLPPKRFLSSSIDDYFVHQRCIHLDKYLQDLLSIPNVAEQHEVWDFLSVSSKNYSFGKSTSVMKALAVNVDDAMDDMLRQFKGVSDGLRKVVGPSPSNITSSLSADPTLTLSWNEEEEMHKQISNYSNVERTHSLFDGDGHDGGQSNNSGWHSDNELKSKSFPPRYVKHNEESSTLRSQRSIQSDKSGRISMNDSKASVASDSSEDPDGMPPEWTPTNVSVPMLNLVDKIFQLNGRGWLRRQAYWIAKQILQLMMEDAIDDWILRQIHSLRRGDVIAQGIHWVQDILWPNGTFFTRVATSEGNLDDLKNNRGSSQTTSRMGDTALRVSSFELQLEAARRASDIKKMIVGGAPATLVSLIGPSQYKRSAKDIYFFLQSNICIKQLGYSILEMVLVSVFPELHSLILDIHESECRVSK